MASNSTLKELHEERLRRSAAQTGEVSGVGSEGGEPDAAQPTPTPTKADTTASESSVLSVRDDFDCALCLKLMLQPITLACGHTHCRQCLTRALALHHHCPLCRAPSFITPRDQPPNFLLSKLIQKMYPEEYAGRVAEAKQDDVEDSTATLPLFLYDDVPVPGQPVVLQFFEPRYLALVRLALEGSKKFGYQVAADAPMGTMVDIQDAVRGDDGKLHIRGVATSRYRVVGDATEQPACDGLVSAPVETFDDLPLGGDDPHGSAALAERQTCTRLRDALSATVVRMLSGLSQHESALLRERYGPIPVEAVKLSFYLLSVLHMPSAIRSQAYQSRNTVDRLQLEYDYLKECDSSSSTNAATPNAGAGAGAGGQDGADSAGDADAPTPATTTILPLEHVNPRQALTMYRQASNLPGPLFTGNTFNSSILIFILVAIGLMYFNNWRRASAGDPMMGMMFM